MRRSLPSDVVDAEVVIRDPPPYRDVLMILAGVGILFLLNPHEMSVRERLWITGPVLGLMVAERILSRGWVQIGPSGVSFGRWFRRARYAWGAIESFVVGNPSEPKIAYVIVRPSDGLVTTPSIGHAVRLPKLFSVSAIELVTELEKKRRIFG